MLLFIMRGVTQTGTHFKTTTQSTVSSMNASGSFMNKNFKNLRIFRKLQPELDAIGTALYFPAALLLESKPPVYTPVGEAHRMANSGLSGLPMMMDAIVDARSPSGRQSIEVVTK